MKNNGTGKRNALLIIMDGWGHGKKDNTNAIHQANTPFIDSLYSTVPNNELRTDGTHVGLPDGQMGNSEVGHLNIGAGRVVFQDLAKINREIENGSFANNKELLRAIQSANDSGSTLHLMGLLSDGGIHSSLEHLFALLDVCYAHKVEKVMVHAFTDGRDTDTNNGILYIKQLEEKLSQTQGEIATVIGRYYAMDRDNRWERINKAYDLITSGKGLSTLDFKKSIQEQYDSGISDEFMSPIVSNKYEGMHDMDVVICFNFRTDRCRQISTVLSQKDMPNEHMKTLNISYFTMTRYDQAFKNIGVLYDKDNLKSTLGEVVSNAGMTQVRMAETEKYPHVTFFFSGGREDVFKGEKRIMANSPKVATYDLQPEMSANELLLKAIANLESEKPNLMILNFANPDMVGHTGVVPAIIKAVETIDACTKQLCETARALNYEVLIIADHGNAELNINPNGTPHTAHTLNPVPIFYLGEKYSAIEPGVLADVAPTLLSLLEIPIPSEMTGHSLLS